MGQKNRIPVGLQPTDLLRGECRDPFLSFSRTEEWVPAFAGTAVTLIHPPAQWPRTASSKIATMLVILIIGLTAGPAVSL